MIEKASKFYEKAWKMVFRPKRREYSSDYIGPSLFTAGADTLVTHIRYSLTNANGESLVCSHIIPEASYRRKEPHPVVIYAHSHGGNRLEGNFLVNLMTPNNISVFLFDFSGSGKSSGKYVTLGWNEKDDLRCVVQHLSKLDYVSQIAVWGRSMGAVSSILCAFVESQKIDALVLDSPFDNLMDLVRNFIYSKHKIPNFLVDPALLFVQSTLIENVGVDIAQINPIEYVKSIRIPGFFIVGEKDDLTPKKTVEGLYKQYGGEKKLRLVEGGHRSERDSEIREEIFAFIVDAFRRSKRDLTKKAKKGAKEGNGNEPSIFQSPIYCNDLDITSNLNSTLNNTRVNASRSKIFEPISKKPIAPTVVLAEKPKKNNMMRPDDDENLEESRGIGFRAIQRHNTYSPRIPVSQNNREKNNENKFAVHNINKSKLNQFFPDLDNHGYSGPTKNQILPGSDESFWENEPSFHERQGNRSKTLPTQPAFVPDTGESNWYNYTPKSKEEAGRNSRAGNTFGESVTVKEQYQFKPYVAEEKIKSPEVLTGMGFYHYSGMPIETSYGASYGHADQKQGANSLGGAGSYQYSEKPIEPSYGSNYEPIVSIDGFKKIDLSQWKASQNQWEPKKTEIKLDSPDILHSHIKQEDPSFYSGYSYNSPLQSKKDSPDLKHEEPPVYPSYSFNQHTESKPDSIYTAPNLGIYSDYTLGIKNDQSESFPNGKAPTNVNPSHFEAYSGQANSSTDPSELDFLKMSHVSTHSYVP